MKSYKILLTAILLAVSFNVAPKIYYYPKKNKKIEQPNVLDLCIFLESRGEEKSKEEEKSEEGKAHTITRELLTAIENKEAIIASSLLMAAVLRISLVKTSKQDFKLINILRKDFNIYITKDKNFAVLIPKLTYKYAQLKKIGLSETVLRKITTKNLGNLIKEFDQQEKGVINIDTLKHIFLPNSSIKKRVYLNGHGSQSNIAELNPKQFLEFIKLMVNIGCEFLYVLSCYVGGLNKLIINKIPEVPFIIAVGSLTDTAAISYREINVKKFFRELNKVLTKKIKGNIKKFLGTTPRKKWWTVFKDAFSHIAGPILENQPSIKYPGIPVFRTVPIKDIEVEVITYPKLLRWELEKKVKPPKEKKPKKPSKIEWKKPIEKEIIVEKKNILIYPSIINVNLVFTGLPKKIISMIPGKAHHYIKSITLKPYEEKKETNFIDLLESFEYKEYAPQKLFFIGDATCENHKEMKSGNMFPFSIEKGNTPEFKNIAIYIPFEDSIELPKYIFQYKNDYYLGSGFIKTDKVKDKLTKFKKIDEKYAEEMIASLIFETTPAKAALYEATIVEKEKNFLKAVQPNLKINLLQEITKLKTLNSKISEIEKKIENINKILDQIQKIFSKTTKKRSIEACNNFLNLLKKEKIPIKLENLTQKLRNKLMGIKEYFHKLYAIKHRYALISVQSFGKMLSYLGILDLIIKEKNCNELQKTLPFYFDETYQTHEFSKKIKVEGYIPPKTKTTLAKINETSTKTRKIIINIFDFIYSLSTKKEKK